MSEWQSEQDSFRSSLCTPHFIGGVCLRIVGVSAVAVTFIGVGSGTSVTFKLCLPLLVQMFTFRAEESYALPTNHSSRGLGTSLARPPFLVALRLIQDFQLRLDVSTK